jgi:Zn-dependent protease
VLSYIQNLFRELDLDFLISTLQRLFSVILCLTVHETAHGFAAYLLGDRTAMREGRLSLNPLRHIDLVGLALLFTAGFGWAKPVPVDMRYFKHPKRGMALSALAGPMSNFLFAVLCLIPVRFMEGMAASAFTLWVFDFLLTLTVMNLGLGLFNLLPIPPLDGSKVLFSLLPDRAYYQLMRYERYGMILLLLLVYFDFGSEFLSNAIGAVFSFLLNLIVL